MNDLIFICGAVKALQKSASTFHLFAPEWARLEHHITPWRRQKNFQIWRHLEPRQAIETSDVVLPIERGGESSDMIFKKFQKVKITITNAPKAKKYWKPSDVQPTNPGSSMVFSALGAGAVPDDSTW